MLLNVILNFMIGLVGGFILELFYRSFKANKTIIPKFVNYQMYGLTSVFLFFIYFLKIDLIYKLILIFIFPTILEFLTGYIYLKIKGIYLWDYAKEPFNFLGLVCLRFSFIWFVLSLVYYYFILPFIN